MEAGCHGADGFLRSFRSLREPGCEKGSASGDQLCRAMGRVRALPKQVWRKPDEARKSRAGRKPMDAVGMFKTLVLSALWNLSADRIHYQVRDRLSLMRFPGLGLGDRVPDGRTLWLYREALGAKRARRRCCFASSTVIWPGGAILRWAGRSSMGPSCRCRATTTRATRTRPSRSARCPTIGPTSQRNGSRKIWTHVVRAAVASAMLLVGLPKPVGSIRKQQVF